MKRTVHITLRLMLATVVLTLSACGDATGPSGEFSVTARSDVVEFLGPSSGGLYRCTVRVSISGRGGSAGQEGVWLGGREALDTDDGAISGTGLRSAEDLTDAMGIDHVSAGVTVSFDRTLTYPGFWSWDWEIEVQMPDASIDTLRTSKRCST